MTSLCAPFYSLRHHLAQRADAWFLTHSLVREARDFEGIEYVPEDVYQGVLRMIDNPFTDGVFIIQQTNGQRSGAALLTPEFSPLKNAYQGKIRWLWVEPRYQGQLVGPAGQTFLELLLDEVQARAEHHGYVELKHALNPVCLGPDADLLCNTSRWEPSTINYRMSLIED